MIFYIISWSFWSAFFVSLVMAESCMEPKIVNGQVSGRASPNFFSGQVRCDDGLHLVGNPVITCRAGTWSGTIPVCAATGSCPLLPLVKNGRTIPIRGSSRSAVRFSCYKGFSLVGERMTHCMGETWSMGELPVCVKAGCEEEAMANIQHGQAVREEDGAVYRYQCEDEAGMEGSKMLYCNGKYWNGTVPSCLVVSSASETENELSNHTLAEESNDDDKLPEKTDHRNITIVEIEAIEEIKSKPIKNDIEEDKLSNETKEKHLTLTNISEEIQDMDSDADYGNYITEIDGIVHETIEKALEVLGVQTSTTEEPIRPENDQNIEIAMIKDDSTSRIVLDSVKSSFISLEASSSSNKFLSSVLILATSSVAFI